MQTELNKIACHSPSSSIFILMRTEIPQFMKISPKNATQPLIPPNAMASMVGWRQRSAVAAPHQQQRNMWVGGTEGRKSSENKNEKEEKKIKNKHTVKQNR